MSGVTAASQIGPISCSQHGSRSPVCFDRTPQATYILLQLRLSLQTSCTTKMVGGQLCPHPSRAIWYSWYPRSKSSVFQFGIASALQRLSSLIESHASFWSLPRLEAPYPARLRQLSICSAPFMRECSMADTALHRMRSHNAP